MQSTLPFFFSDEQRRNTMMAIETPNSNQNSVYLNMEGDDVTTTDEPPAELPEDATSSENPAGEDDVATEDQPAEESGVDTTPAPETEPIVSSPTPPANKEATPINMNNATPAVKDGASAVPIDIAAVTAEANEKKKTITIAILCTLLALLALGGISYGIYYYITNNTTVKPDPIVITTSTTIKPEPKMVISETTTISLQQQEVMSSTTTRKKKKRKRTTTTPTPVSTTTPSPAPVNPAPITSVGNLNEWTLISGSPGTTVSCGTDPSFFPRIVSAQYNNQDSSCKGDIRQKLADNFEKDIYFIDSSFAEYLDEDDAVICSGPLWLKISFICVQKDEDYNYYAVQ